MNALLPIIEELDDAGDHPARAKWLLVVPLSILMKYQDTIINRLRNKFFVDGVAYVEAELALSRQVRKAGLPNNDNPLRAEMLAIAGYRAIEATEI